MTDNYMLHDDFWKVPPQSHLNPSQRILVVEDECDLRQISAEVLIDSGYRVDVAEDGVAAWAALQLYNYDLLITDQFMPKLSGVDLLRKMHAAHMGIPVIMATGVLPTWEFALHTWLQPVMMLRKPYTFEKLLGMVKKALPVPAGARAETAPSPNRQRQPEAVGSQP
jgi:DNA-binding NtrC family response regulator